MNIAIKAFLLLSITASTALTNAAIASSSPDNTVVLTRAFSDDTYGKYQITVLKRALDVTPEYGDTTLKLHPQPMSQSRQIRTLLNGKADVMWSVTSQSREEKLIPVRLPLLRGYSGHRVFVVNTAKQAEFQRADSLDELKQKQFVQGADWPDFKILEANGFGVIGETWNTWFKSMYLLVERDIVDGFPRNVIEIHDGIRRLNSKKLTIETRHLLSYPNYEYFFVRGDRQALADRIRLGLIRLIKSGELAQIFNSIETHRLANEIVNDTNRLVHKLNNPLISYRLNYADWINTPELAVKAMEKEMGYMSLAIDSND